MADKVQMGVRLPTDVADRVEEYAEQRDISKSDALRRLIISGLRDDPEQIDQLAEAVEELQESVDRIGETTNEPLLTRLL